MHVDEEYLTSGYSTISSNKLEGVKKRRDEDTDSDRGKRPLKKDRGQ